MGKWLNGASHRGKEYTMEPYNDTAMAKIEER